jgi:decaprenylphospho-beta-D-ribofuranose 2-oxidase
MSHPDLAAAPATTTPHANSTQRLLSGWGRTSPTRAWVLAPRGQRDIEALMDEAPAGGLIARGSGLSYGDAAQNGGGFVLDATALRGAPAIDSENLLARTGAGTTFAELLEVLAAHGLTLPVVPGTARLTVGGAIASDVHGKNHVTDGSFAAQVSSFRLLTPAAGAVEVSESDAPELFAATVGGMGLTGVILEATLRVEPLRSRETRADFDATRDLPTAIELMSQTSEHRYSIAWLDLLSGGDRFGRAIVTRSRDPEAGEDGDRRARGAARRHHPPPVYRHARVGVPERFPALLRPSTVQAFNSWHWHTNSRRGHGRRVPMSANLFPLDALAAWNRLYGRDGLVQYQFAVPHGQEDMLLAVPDALRRKRIPMYLAVLKRFGAPSSGLLSFPLRGWTLAIDIPAGAPGLPEALDEQDEHVAACGGRIYLAKDARARAATIAAMYPGLQRFLQVRADVDPEGMLRSDLSRRLGL